MLERLAVKALTYAVALPYSALLRPEERAAAAAEAETAGGTAADGATVAPLPQTLRLAVHKRAKRALKVHIYI